MSNQHSKCDDCYKTHLPENHDRTILPSDAFSEGYVPEFNQASEDEPTKSKVDWSTPYDEWLISILNRFRYGGAIECRAIPSEIQLNIESLIRTEKLKLLDKFENDCKYNYTTFGNSEKMLQVSGLLKRIEAERTKLEAEL